MMHFRGNFLERLGTPYESGNQCDSCPDSCEYFRAKKYGGQKRSRGKRSFSIKESKFSRTKLYDANSFSNMVSVVLTISSYDIFLIKHPARSPSIILHPIY